MAYVFYDIQYNWSEMLSENQVRLYDAIDNIIIIWFICAMNSARTYNTLRIKITCNELLSKYILINSH